MKILVDGLRRIKQEDCINFINETLTKYKIGEEFNSLDKLLSRATFGRYDVNADYTNTDLGVDIHSTIILRDLFVNRNARQLLSRYELNNVLDTTTYPQVVTTMGSQNQYDADGRVHYAQDLRNGNFDRGYSYDQVGRLQEATSGREARGLAAANPADSPYSQTYSYDVWNNMGRTARHWTEGQSDLPSYSNNRRADWNYDAQGNALVSSQSKSHGYDAAGQQTHFYEEVWSGPWDNWVFQQNTIDQIYGGDGQTGKRVETRHTEDINGNITNDLKTAYYLRSSVMGGASIAEIDPSGQREGHVYVGGEKIADYNGWAPSGWMVIRHANPITGNWVGVQVPGYSGRRTEFDPLGADVGKSDPYPSHLGYTDIIGDNFLYNELGNPFDLGHGCGTLDGMPISCSELQNRMENGTVAEQYLFRDTRVVTRNGEPVRTGHGFLHETFWNRVQKPISSLGLGLFSVEAPIADNEGGDWKPQVFAFNHPQNPAPTATDRQKDFYKQNQKKLARCIWQVFGRDYQGNPLNGAAILPHQTLGNAPAIDTSRTTASMPGNALGFVSDSDLTRGRFGTINMASNIGPFMNQSTGSMMTTAEVWNRTYAHELGNVLAGRIAGSMSGADTIFGDPRGIENASNT